MHVTDAQVFVTDGQSATKVAIFNTCRHFGVQLVRSARWTNGAEVHSCSTSFPREKQFLPDLLQSTPE